MELKVPNLGENISESNIIAIHLEKGKEIQKDDIILELETDKATLEIPSPDCGIVKEILVKVGDSIKQGQVVAILEESTQKELEEQSDKAQSEKPEISTETIEQQTKPESKPPKTDKAETQPTGTKTPASKQTSVKQPIILKDLGEGIEEANILKIAVKKGDEIKEGTILIELETDKSTIEIPSDFAGKVESIAIKEGDKIKTGQEILTISIVSSETTPTKEEPTAKKPTENKPVAEKSTAKKPTETTQIPIPTSSAKTILVPASPLVRRFAREIGIDIRQVKGTLARERICIEDVKAYAKKLLQSGKTSISSAARTLPDFSTFGETEILNLNKIKQTTATHMAATWQTVPQVTNHNEVDITDLEKMRQKYKKSVEEKGGKLTFTIILLKALIKTLIKFPNFNASYDNQNQTLVLKKYYHLGLAVDTENGLLVPVLKDVEQKNILQIALEVGELSQKARDRKLSPEEMQGSCFTVSSLGGLGKIKFFSPIVNWPDVAILGISRSTLEAKYIEDKLTPRLILPLSLSYDHRVIDGAEATRFMNYLTSLLENPFFSLLGD